MSNAQENPQAATIDVSKFPTLKEVEREYFNLVLSKTSGNKTEAAKILGVTIKTIYNKLDSYKAPEATEQKSE